MGESRDNQGQVESFLYAECAETVIAPSWTGWTAVPDLLPGAEGPQRAGEPMRSDPPAGMEEALAEAARRAFQEGRQHGLEEGRRLEKEAQAGVEAARARERVGRAAAMVEEFARERDRYLGEVEQEAVKLAMTIASRILRREAQTDPLLVIGAVRMALGQIPAATEVRLLVPAAEIDLWTEAVGLLPNRTVRPRIIAAEEMQRGDCRIETSLGWADLGIEAQLGEMGRALLESKETPQAASPEEPR